MISWQFTRFNTSGLRPHEYGAYPQFPKQNTIGDAMRCFCDRRWSGCENPTNEKTDEVIQSSPLNQLVKKPPSSIGPANRSSDLETSFASTNSGGVQRLFRAMGNSSRAISVFSDMIYAPFRRSLLAEEEAVERQRNNTFVGRIAIRFDWWPSIQHAVS